jgi:shikimate kinase
MGTGKSEVGKKLAVRLKRVFIDTDTLIEETAGTSIAQIFAERGESYFRQLERQMISQACLQSNVVIATGGGAIVDEENARQLKDSGTVICLTATPETILARVQDNSDRPLLQGDNPLEKIRILLQTRAEAYAKADLMIDTSGLAVDDVVQTVCRALEVC